MNETRVIFMKGDRLVVVQGVDHDIAVQGPSPEEALVSFCKVVSAQIFEDVSRDREPLQDVPAGPGRFLEMWSEASDPRQRGFDTQSRAVEFINERGRCKFLIDSIPGQGDLESSVAQVIRWEFEPDTDILLPHATPFPT